MWNKQGASLDFQLAPHFYQTRWFYALAILCLAVGGLGIHRAHVGRMQKGFAAVLAERARMAREIHDTLLQGFAGTALQLHVVGETLKTAPQSAKSQLEHLLSQIDLCLTEARRSIGNLRSLNLESSNLPAALANMAQQLTAGTTAHSRVEVTGRPRLLPAPIEDNLLRIGQEAVANAVKYAQAEEIRLELHFEPRLVQLRAQDNGRGFLQDQMIASSEPHFGLLGMRERAEEVSGRFSLSSIPGKGTEIQVRVPLG